jgi:hypothetical protein
MFTSASREGCSCSANFAVMLKSPVALEAPGAAVIFRLIVPVKEFAFVEVSAASLTSVNGLAAAEVEDPPPALESAEQPPRAAAAISASPA